MKFNLKTGFLALLLLVSQSASATVLPQTVDSLLETYKITPPTQTVIAQKKWWHAR